MESKILSHNKGLKNSKTLRVSTKSSSDLETSRISRFLPAVKDVVLEDSFAYSGLTSRMLGVRILDGCQKPEVSEEPQSVRK